MVLEKLGRQKNKKIYLDTGFTLFTKIKLKWIIDLNGKHKTIKLLEDIIGKNLDDLGSGDAFLDTTPKTQSMKEITDKLDFVQIKNFNPVRRQATDWEKIFA